VSEESGTVFWFGKHEGRDLKETPGGYLRWMVAKLDPTPRPEDAEGKTPEEIKAMTERMRNFISEAEDELAAREETRSENRDA